MWRFEVKDSLGLIATPATASAVSETAFVRIAVPQNSGIAEMKRRKKLPVVIMKSSPECLLATLHCLLLV